MNRKIIALVFTAFSFLPLTSFADTLSTTPSKDTAPVAVVAPVCDLARLPSINAVWLWDSTIVTDDPASSTKRADFFKFATDQGINTVYVSSYGIITGKSDDNKAKLADFISQAHSSCINTELLAGESNWADRKNIFKVINFVNEAIDFTNSLSGPKPTAIHLDVEPYADKSWNTNGGANRPAIANKYLNMLSSVDVLLKGTNIDLNVDIPSSFDTANGISSIARGKEAKSLAAFVIDIADTTTVMGFRDTAYDVYDATKGEMNYASSVGKKVVIGLETKCFANPNEQIFTFCGSREIGTVDAPQTLIKGLEYMKGEVTKIIELENLNTYTKTFSGFAYHQYETFSLLK